MRHGGSYTVEPSKDGYILSPASQDFNNVTANQTQDFIADLITGKISFASDRDGNYEIYVMVADGTNQTRLTYNSAYDLSPSVSPF